MIERHPFSDISWKVTEPEYRADPALSYSTLSRFESNGKFRAIPTLDEKISTPSLIFGSVVDALTTGGYGEFNELFLVADMPEISENLENIARSLYAQFGDSFMFDDIPDEALAKTGEDCGYYAGAKYYNYRIKLIKENCKTMYNLLIASASKTLISQKDYDDAVRCKEAFLSSPYTSWYFQESENGEIENYYQLKFKGKDPNTGINYRCMADLIRVSHESKTVFPCDVKTSSKPEELFFKSFLQYNYNLQSRNYWRLIRAAMDADPYYKEYKLADYRFLVVNRNTLTPMAWLDSKTQAVGTVHYKTKSGYMYTVRDPYEIGLELTRYKNEQPQYPFEAQALNNITKCIEES